MSIKRTWGEVLRAFLNGFSQIILQENILTGILFLAGIFCGSLYMGLAASLAVVTGTLTAITAKYSRIEVIKGLYGFSAALVGVTIALFFQSTIFAWITILLGSILAAKLQHLFIAWKIPGYKFSFVIVTWICLFVFPQVPQLAPLRGMASGVVIVQSNFDTVFLGFGQLILQDKWWVGLLFLVGILINSPMATIFGIVGAILSEILSNYLREPLTTIYSGLSSYNAVLLLSHQVGGRIIYMP